MSPWLLLALALPSPNDDVPARAPLRALTVPSPMARADPATSTARGRADVEPAPRTLGELNENCQAARDCRPEFPCTDRVCVAKPEPKADDAPPFSPERVEPSTSLRATFGLRGGWAYNHRARRDLLRGSSSVAEDHQLAGDLLVGLELGLADDRLLIGAAIGPTALSGFEAWAPTLQAELRAAWRLWRGSPSVGLYLEPQVTMAFGEIPGHTPSEGGSPCAFARTSSTSGSTRAGSASRGAPSASTT